MQAKFGYRLDDPKWAPEWLPNEQLEMLHSDVDARQIIDGEFDQLLQDLKVCWLPWLAICPGQNAYACASLPYLLV